MNVMYPSAAVSEKGSNLRTQTERARPEDLSGDFKELYSYWNSRRDGAFAPAWARFDWTCLPPQLIPRCAVVDVKRNPLDFVYRFWGTRRTSVQGAD